MLDITIIIPTRGDRKELLEEAIKSIDEQIESPKKVVIAQGDNNQYDRINKAVYEADTKYILLFSDDDKLPSNFLQEVYKFAEKNDVPIVATFLENFGDDTGIHGPGQHPFFSSLFTKKMFVDVGGFDKKMLKMADVDFWVRCFNKGYTWQVCPTTFYYYRKHPKQDSKQDWKIDRIKYLKKHGKFID